MSTPPRRHVTAAALSCARIYRRQSLGEEAQASTATQGPLLDRAVADLRRQGVISHDMPVVVYEDVNCARTDDERPNFLRLLSDVKRGDVVVACWRDRLGAGPAYVSAVETITKKRGARLYVADPRVEEIAWDKTRHLLEAIHASNASSYVEELRQKTRAALRRQLEAGYAAGKVGFGFKTQIDPATRRVVGGVEQFNKRILIDEEAAQLIRGIFEMRAAPMGWQKIAKTLNTSGARTPAGGWWTSSTLRDLLFNEKYIGRWSMGDTKVTKTGGRRVIEEGDDPVVIDLPHLRIIPQELWDAVHATNAKRRTNMRDVMNAGKPSHALTGVLRCRECGGAMGIVHSKGRRFYACSRRRRSGVEACSAKATIPSELLEGAILPAAAAILTAAEETVRKGAAEAAARRAVATRGDAGEVERELEGARERLRKARKIAFANDDDSEETIAHLKRLAERVKDLEESKARASMPADQLTAQGVEQEAVAQLADIRAALAADANRCREALMALFTRGISIRVTAESIEIESVPAFPELVAYRPQVDPLPLLAERQPCKIIQFPGTSIGCTPPRVPSGIHFHVQPLKLSIPRRSLG